MPSMSPPPEPILKHVPAWKKLGLKLKFAKEEPEESQPRENGTVDRKKRKTRAGEEHGGENTQVERSVKKVKKSKSRVEESHQDEGMHKEDNKDSQSSIKEPAKLLNGYNKSSNEPTKGEGSSKKAKKTKVKTDVSTAPNPSKHPNAQEQESAPPVTSKTTPSSKGKSVTFTPDTKTTDGDSVKNLYKTWIAKQIATDPSFNPSTLSPALKPILPSVVASPASPTPLTSASPSISDPTSKKPQKKPKTRLPKISSGAGPSRFDTVLAYLTAHQTTPQTWKFSKAHQNQILKHLFSLRHIPSSYDSALLTYIRGLKGTSARSRLRQDALAVRDEDEKWLSSEPLETEKMQNETAAQCNARRRRDYEAAVARFKQTLRDKEDEREELERELSGEKEEEEERFRKRKRAELVLWSVGPEETVVVEEPPIPSSSTPQNNITFGRNDAPPRLNSGIAQLVHAAQDPGPAPRVGRGVGMGMGGVEAIDAGGIARGSRGKKVVFGNDDDDDGAAAVAKKIGGTNNDFGRANGAGVGQANGIPREIKKFESGIGASNGREATMKKKRKRKTRTGVPDDDDSSSSSESSSSEEEQQPQKRQTVVANGGGGSEDSDSSASSSGGDSDSD